MGKQDYVTWEVNLAETFRLIIRDKNGKILIDMPSAEFEAYLKILLSRDIGMPIGEFKKLL